MINNRQENFPKQELNLVKKIQHIFLNGFPLFPIGPVKSTHYIPPEVCGILSTNHLVLFSLHKVHTYLLYTQCSLSHGTGNHLYF